MHASCSSLVLLAELHPGTGHLSTLRGILEQAHIEVLMAKELAMIPAENAQEWLVKMTTEHQPSAIVLSLDHRVFTGSMPLSNYSNLLPKNVPIIIAAEDFDASQICNALEMGATDFIVAPFTPASVVPRIWRLIKHSAFFSSSPVRASVREKVGIQRLDLLGESPLFLEEIGKLPLVARCDVTVMIQGETGTGKELVARAVHYLSPRYDRPFVPIDCGAIPPELAESELFGHERGAFTGAVTKNPGLISAADQGTLFLDEVDALSLSVQAKLLRFLQQMEYRPLGSNKIKRADVRVISATNGDLQERVSKGEFREDLFYRLHVVQLRLPALRQRREDVVLLAKHFAAKYSVRFRRPAFDFTHDALQKLLMHHWPGNIRELENIVEAAVALCRNQLIGESDLPFAAQGTHSTVSFREAKARTIREFERDYIIRLLYAYGGNVSKAARAAGKNRRALWELIRKYRIDARELKGLDAGAGEGEKKQQSPTRAAATSARHRSSG
jgi:two-component system, NtrC family, response regulator GlrR